MRNLIDNIKLTYGVSRNSAKKRVVELGYKQARGVYEWGYMDYAEDFDVPEDFPDDYTYTLSLYEMSKILGKSMLFDKYVYSGAFIYADGHLVLNLPKYVVKRYDKYYLTAYAKANMSEFRSSAFMGIKAITIRSVSSIRTILISFASMNLKQKQRERLIRLARNGS